MDDAFHLDIDPGIDEYREAAAKRDPSFEAYKEQQYQRIGIACTAILIIGVCLSLVIMLVYGAIGVGRSFL